MGTTARRVESIAGEVTFVWVPLRVSVQDCWLVDGRIWVVRDGIELITVSSKRAALRFSAGWAGVDVGFSEIFDRIDHSRWFRFLGGSSCRGERTLDQGKNVILEGPHEGGIVGCKNTLTYFLYVLCCNQRKFSSEKKVLYHLVEMAERYT